MNSTLVIRALQKIMNQTVVSNAENSIKEIEKLRPQLVKAAQKVYDAWQVDEDGYDWQVGKGGICHLIADAFTEVIPSDFEITSVSSDHEVHVWIAVLAEDGIYKLDIPHEIYETGGGYNWEKIPDVEFEPNDITIEHIASVDEWDNYVEE